VIGTYVAALAVCGASLAIGQAAIGLCGAREWSWLSPAVGLALLGAVCWGTVRLPGHGTLSAIAVLVLAAAAVAFMRGRVDGVGGAMRVGAPVAVLALAAASLPFIVEGHFGILGTSLNPDMSQHLLAADRLAHGEGSQLLHQGYPLGPHSIVVALNEGLGVGFVQGFSGLTVAVAVLAPLTALTAFADLPPLRRAAAALLAGLPYLVASYFAQGAFKETMQALFVLAFALALRESTKRGWVGKPLRLVPAALIAVGSVYTYSFPGLIWPIGTAAIWVVAEFALGRKRLPAGGARRGAENGPSLARPQAPLPVTGSAVWRPVSLAVLLFVALVAPEIGRLIDFRSFETFEPHGPGLGNLFGQVSPFEALGIWPSGDFRLAPGAGAAPAIAYYLGAAFALALLLLGLQRCWRRRETAIVSGLAAAAVAYVVARVGGTPYTAAKAIEIAAPLCTLVILIPLLGAGSRGAPRTRAPLTGLATALYLLLAGGCSLLALANAPVGPASYSPALAELRPLLTSGSTLVLASAGLLDEQHGAPYIAWELRGGRVCIEAETEAGDAPPPGVRFVIAEGSPGAPPFPRLQVRRVAEPYVLWERTTPTPGKPPCPLIAVRQARQGPVR
jgi:hypothetical protein